MKQTARIHRTVYRFGALSTDLYGHMVLRENGSIGFYRDPNESSYSFDGRELHFYDATGAVSNTLPYYVEANCFLSQHGAALNLLPILEVADRVPLEPARREDADTGLPPIFINSIPKSGTYFLEAAFSALGARALRLHLAHRCCYDYRGVSDEQMHRDPRQHSVAAPAGAVAHILQPGDLVVGHVDDHSQLNEFAHAGVTVLNCVRNLRDVLVSLYHFKRSKVVSVSPADTAWRSLEPVHGFIAFFNFFARDDIAFISHMAEIILERPESMIRFEDAVNATVQEGLPAGLGTGRFNEVLRRVRNQPTSTLSGHDRNYAALWSPAAEFLFEAHGLAALNRRLGYGA